MATTTIDIIEGAAVEEVAGRIERIVRIAKVSGLTSTTNTLAEALDATGMPAPGEAHPDNSDLIVRARIPRSDGRTDGCEVQIVYLRSDEYPISISDLAVSGGGGLRSVMTNKDVNGERIVVRGPKDENNNLGKEQAVRIPVFRPHDTLTIELYEQLADPKAEQRLWKGKVNAAGWLNDAAGEWLCVDVVYRLADATTTPRAWSVVCFFEYDSENWNNKEVVAEDPSNPGHELPNPNWAAEQFVWVDLYKDYDFGVKFQ